MELTEIELEVYNVLKDLLNISEVEFANLPIKDKNDWIESYRLAKLLYENRREDLYKGYKDTNIYKNNQFDIIVATEMVRQKKNILDDLKEHMNFKGSLPQFILLGDKLNYKLVNEGIKNINIKNVLEMETTE